MFCTYGSRCQYIHNQISPEKQKEIPYSRVLYENAEFNKYRIELLEEGWLPLEFSTNLNYISCYYRNRLKVFIRLSEGKKDYE